MTSAQSSTVQIGDLRLDRRLLAAFETGSVGAVRDRLAASGALTPTEIRTIQYALDHFALSEPGKRELRDAVLTLAQTPTFAWHRQVNVLAQRLELSGAGPSHLNAHMVDHVDTEKLFLAAQAIAATRVTDGRLQRVDISGRNDQPGLLFVFEGTDGTYAVRLDAQCKKMWEADYGPGGSFATVADLSPLRIRLKDAFHAAFALLPDADWNNASIGVGDDGGLHVQFWNSYAWQEQPSVNVDGRTGIASIETG